MILLVLGNTWGRFAELLVAPLNEHTMLWFAIPLVIATIMMTLYFGRYRKEELGWNTAFANAMVFIFVSIDIIRKMYESSQPHSWLNILDNGVYFTVTVALSGFGALSLLVIYYHLLPKQIAFKLFSNLPVNITIYVLMCVVYAGVAFDNFTLLAGILLFLVAWGGLKLLQILQKISGKRHEEAENGAWEEKGPESEYELKHEEKDGVETSTVETAKHRKKKKTI